MEQKKYLISLDNLPDHEHIIFKLICSVSERTKNRSKSYALSSDKTNTDILIDDIKNRSAEEQATSLPANVWVSDKKEDPENSISRPLIATRVLHTLDLLIDNIDAESDNEKQVDAPKSETFLQTPSEDEATIDFNISEEEASELAIVHDEVLENPSNQETFESGVPGSATNVELTLIKNNQQKSQISAQNKSSKQQVLVVDDSPSVRKQLEIELDLFDVNVDFAECAEAAFDLLNSKTYDVALLDVVLPDKDGFQICKHIKTQSKSTIAIMLTGKATQADKIKGSLAGCDAYLVKPVGRQTFQNTAKNYLSLKSSEAAIEA